MSSPGGRGNYGRRSPGERAASGERSSRRRGPRGRETAAAESGTRQIWYGYGHLSRREKDGYGVFLHDVVRIYGEVSVISLPVLLFVWAYPTTAFLDVTAMATVAWLTMTLVGTLVRGGWIQPLATDTPGWVTLAPTLLGLRLGYFNLTFAVSSFGGLALADVTGVGPLGLLWSIGVAALAMLLFPRVAEEWLAGRG